METIIITTDFSTASHNAAVYGIELAKFLHAEVVLVHVCQPILVASDVAIEMTPVELKEGSEELLQEEAQKLASEGSVNIRTVVEEGLPAEAILSVANSVNAKWIITGMKGGNRTARRLFGGTAISLSRKTNRPLILVPEGARFNVPKTIALASGIDDETDVHIIDPLEELGLKCECNMYVVRVIKKGMDEVIERLLRPSRIKWHCKDLHPSFEFLNDNDVAHALNEFVKEHNVDMVAMIAREHNLFERIFAKSDIREMIIHTHVPLIILPGKVDTSYANELDESVAKSHA